MAILGAILGIIVLLGGPCAIAAWIASRVRWPLIAFLLAWVLTPLVNVLGVLVYAPFAPAGNDGTWAIMLPLYGVGTGLISGTVAAVVVVRRRARAGRPSATGNAAEAPERIDAPREVRL